MVVYLDTNVYIGAKYVFDREKFDTLRSRILEGNITVLYTTATVDAAFAASKEYDVDTAANVISELSASYPTVSVKFTNTYGHELTKTESIVWSAPAGFSAGKVGTYTFEGTVSAAGVNYTGNAIKVTATVKINALKVTSVTNPADIEVFVGDAITLPSTVNVKVTGNKDATLSVTWTPSSVNNSVAGVTNLVGTLTGTDKIEVPADKKAALKVTVKNVIYTTATVDSGFAPMKSYLIGKTNADAVLSDLNASYSSVSGSTNKGAETLINFKCSCNLLSNVSLINLIAFCVSYKFKIL